MVGLKVQKKNMAERNVADCRLPAGHGQITAPEIQFVLHGASGAKQVKTTLDWELRDLEPLTL